MYKIGVTADQEAAGYIREHVTKPLMDKMVDYVVEISAPPDKTMGHAGAIISRGGGTAKEKIEALEGGGCGKESLECSWEDKEDDLSKSVYQDLIDLRFSSQKLINFGSLFSFPTTSACS